MQTVLVTGASGLLGANFVLTALDTGWRVIAATHAHALTAQPHLQNEAVNLMEAREIEPLIARTQPQWIVHCAAAVNVDWCEEHPSETQRMNVDASAAIARAAQQHGARMVHISTDAVFDGVIGNYTETDAINPLSIYARSKADAERAVATELPEALIARVNIYGWNMQAKTSLAEWSLNKLERGENVPGFRDVTFNPMLVNDLSDVLLALMARGARGVLHVFGAEAISKYEFARSVARVFGLNEALVESTSIADAHLRAPRSLNLTMSVAQVENLLDQKMPSVENGLRRFRQLREQGFVRRLKQLATL
jgi:dTDP-4-dehydrorhamnose reductase